MLLHSPRPHHLGCPKDSVPRPSCADGDTRRSIGDVRYALSRVFRRGGTKKDCIMSPSPSQANLYWAHRQTSTVVSSVTIVPRIRTSVYFPKAVSHVLVEDPSQASRSQIIVTVWRERLVGIVFSRDPAQGKASTPTKRTRALVDAVICGNETPFLNQVLDRKTSNSRHGRTLMADVRSKLLLVLLDVCHLQLVTSINQVIVFASIQSTTEQDSRMTFPPHPPPLTTKRRHPR